MEAVVISPGGDGSLFVANVVCERLTTISGNRWMVIDFDDYVKEITSKTFKISTCLMDRSVAQIINPMELYSELSDSDLKYAKLSQDDLRKVNSLLVKTQHGNVAQLLTAVERSFREVDPTFWARCIKEDVGGIRCVVVHGVRGREELEVLKKNYCRAVTVKVVSDDTTDDDLLWRDDWDIRVSVERDGERRLCRDLMPKLDQLYYDITKMEMSY